VIRDTGAPKLLRGVNRSGLEYAFNTLGFLDAAGITERDIDQIVNGWHANIIRLPFNQDRVIRGVSRGGITHPASLYLSSLDQVIRWASARGAYTLLDLQWLDDVTPHGGDPASPNRVPCLPDRNTAMVWRLLAARYHDEPAVLFDLFNEPHSPIFDAAQPLRNDTVPLLLTPDATSTTTPPVTVTTEHWHAWARLLVDTIRAVHSNSLIFVSGIDWAYDLRDLPLTPAASNAAPYRNLVYSTHVYPWFGPSISASLDPTTFPTLSPTGSSPNWETAFGQYVPQFPVFAAEWGFEAAPGPTQAAEEIQLRAWGEALDRYLDSAPRSGAQHFQVGWTAWDWINFPHLRRPDPVTGAMAPTAFGDVVGHRLAYTP